MDGAGIAGGEAGVVAAVIALTAVTFTLGPGNLGFYTHIPDQFAAEPGAVTVYVGDSLAGGQ